MDGPSTLDIVDAENLIGNEFNFENVATESMKYTDADEDRFTITVSNNGVLELKVV